MYRWYDLADYAEVAARGGLYRQPSAELGDETLASAVVGSWNGTKTWRINGSCTQLRGVAGAVKDDDTTSDNKVSVLADSRAVFAHRFAPGEAMPFTVSLRGAQSSRSVSS